MNPDRIEALSCDFRKFRVAISFDSAQCLVRLIIWIHR